jgi:protein ImuA
MEIPGAVKTLDLAASRRLVLAAAESGVTAFLIRCSAELEPSATETRWRVRAACSARDDENWGYPLFAAELVRNRHGPAGQWLMEWKSENGIFRTADSGAVVSAPSDRPLAAAGTRAPTFSRVA